MQFVGAEQMEGVSETFRDLVLSPQQAEALRLKQEEEIKSRNDIRTKAKTELARFYNERAHLIEKRRGQIKQ